MGVRPIRVLVADDHAMVREGFVEMLCLQDDMEVVAEAANGKEAIALARQTEPDVVILDVDMPVMGGQAALKRLREISPRPRVVIVTVFAEQFLVREMLDLGASAYLSKNSSMENLVATVRSVGREEHEDSVILSVPRGALTTPEGGPPEDTLSSREMQVLLAVARGMSNSEAGKSLHLSESTVKRHLSNIYAKLDVGSRSEAVSKAISEGWISSWDVARDDSPRT